MQNENSVIKNYIYNPEKYILKDNYQKIVTPIPLITKIIKKEAK